MVTLNPHVLTDVEISLPASGSGTLGIYEFTYRKSKLDSNLDWFEPVMVAEVVIP